MSIYQQITRGIGDQLVASLGRVEKAIASTGGSIREKVDLPELPILDNLSAALTEHLPSAREIVHANFELTERLLAAHRNLALRLVGATGSACLAPAPRGPQKVSTATDASQ
jgi:hypothetical protein